MPADLLVLPRFQLLWTYNVIASPGSRLLPHRVAAKRAVTELACGGPANF